jgi:hypothetical protein
MGLGHVPGRGRTPTSFVYVYFKDVAFYSIVINKLLQVYFFIDKIAFEFRNSQFFLEFRR